MFTISAPLKHNLIYIILDISAENDIHNKVNKVLIASVLCLVMKNRNNGIKTEKIDANSKRSEKTEIFISI